MMISAEELASIEKAAVYSLNDKTLFQLLDHIAALQADLAASEAARERAEELLNLIRALVTVWLDDATADRVNELISYYFTHTEEN